MAQVYPVRNTHRKGLTSEALEEKLREHFGSVTGRGAEASASFGAISSLRARPVGKDLEVTLTMDPKVPENVARDTINRYNRFLEDATGFSSKERAKRLRKSAGGD